MKEKRMLRAWLLFALWAGVIFYFSAQPDTVSSEQSGFFASILESVVHTLRGGEETASQALYDLLDFIVRKGAHFTVYLVLGVLALRAYRRSGVKAGAGRVALSLFTCALYAATDEVHQYFVPGRAMMLTDVLLDSAGALCGILTGEIFLKKRRE